MISFANSGSNSVENILMHEQLRHSGDRHVSMAVPRWRFTLLLSRNEDEVRQDEYFSQPLSNDTHSSGQLSGRFPNMKVAPLAKRWLSKG